MSFSERYPRVLCFSREAVLLETRQQVLNKRYSVVGVNSVEEMMALDPGLEFDVVILCHTLSVNDCDFSTQFVRARWPGAKIVALSVEQKSCSEIADRVVRGLDGPRFLLNTIDQLVAT